ncbi:MAG: response regulator [Deltaproteobacteria bacterium]|nr:MAG: response regulator [Deltaproteobacteria bacterium]
MAIGPPSGSREFGSRGFPEYRRIVHSPKTVCLGPAKGHPMEAVKQRNILVVDDEEHVRESLSAVLGREGYVVHLADSGERGLQLLKEQPVIQLVISDYNMPGMNGVEFLKLIRERHPNVVRIMLTGDPDPQTIIRSINEGEVYRFIKKPWDNTLLRVTVYFAFETIQLEEENRRLIAALRRQVNVLRDLEREFPYLSALARDEDAALLLAEADLVRTSGS